MVRVNLFLAAVLSLAVLCLAACGPVSEDTESTLKTSTFEVSSKKASVSPVKVAAQGATDLSGMWHWSVDPYADGYAGFHGGQAGYGSRRYNFIDVEAEMRKNPTALFEYDMDHAKTAKIPGAWIGHEPEMRHYQGVVWYQREFEVTPRSDERLFLEFGAVNYKADVYLNGERLGQHEGGFTPFSFEVTDIAIDGVNQLTVGVDSRRDWQSVPPPVTDWETYGGITRPVHFVRRPETYIAESWVRLDDDGRIRIDARLDGSTKAGQAMSLRIPELDITLDGQSDAEGNWTTDMPLPADLALWSPKTPQLYTVEVESADDRWTDRIGFRTIALNGEDILLNGKPIFLRGISIHEEEIGSNPVRDISATNARALLSEVKDGLNGNFVRLAHYPHSDVMTRMADELGLIVWSEIPVYWRIDWENDETLALSKSMIEENILRDRNRASILFWSVGNETPISDRRNDFMNALVAKTRELDSSRLVTAALMTSKQEEGGVLTARITDPLADQLDVLSVNTYDGWYGPVAVGDVSEIRWDLDFDKPLIFSEFGAGAYIGLSGEDVPRKFSVEYQDEMYRETLEMSAEIPSLRGISPWILKDFRSPRRQHSIYQNGWNRKGVITETGERKPAFHTLSEHYKKLADDWE
ncbi:MAG: beta-glucuronidase [Hyphomonadaceae bacterium]|nr:beta-glucuronidase [Hyphomonadaceae bacterium]